MGDEEVDEPRKENVFLLEEQERNGASFVSGAQPEAGGGCRVALIFLCFASETTPARYLAASRSR